MAQVLEMFSRVLLEEKEEEASTLSTATSIWGIVTFLVVLSISFEHAKERLDESVSETMKPVLATFFAEMTLLGFIGLVFFFINKLEMLNGLSETLFGEEEALNEMFEMVHMVLFLVMMIFLTQIVFQLKFATTMEKDWEEYESYVVHLRDLAKKKEDTKEAQDEYDDACREYYHDPNFLRYVTLRQQFLDPVEKRTVAEASEEKGGKTEEKKSSGPGDEFDFAKYLGEMLADDLEELVEVPIWAWVGLWCLFGVYWAYDLAISGSIFELLIGMFAGAFVLGGFTIHMKNKVRTILSNMLLPEQASSVLGLGGRSGGQDYGSTDDVNIPLMPTSADMPAYHNITLTPEDVKEHNHHLKHYKLANPNLLKKQMKLFWRKDPELLLKCLQACTLLQAVISGISALLIFSPDLDMSTQNRIIMGLVGLSLLGFSLYQVPELLEHFVFVLHLEQFKDKSTIYAVQREMRAKKTLGVLKMLGWMKSKIQQVDNEEMKEAKESKREKAPEKTAAQIWSNPAECARKTKEVKEIFDLFDEDNSGSISLDEFGKLLSSVAGITDPAELHDIATTLDESGDGEVDFEEFLNWYARRQEVAESMDNEELVKRIFRVVDKDGSGHIDIPELAEAFESLGEKVSEADLQWLLSECDEDGSGTIDMEEFTELLNKYVFDE